ncbi:TFIIB-type zinc finger domain-containing protein [Labrys monachus]|uniref:Uncharacterized protein n=1 Tax=Labrys monachus TaxID=217067 RepID=A0ABU0F8E4_9HYPH|nr:TFIIB-type zinc finger domain-containing protein [Labrys monachus]MDQ0390315.1 hypothetical protein [Labrys monachus]
MANPIRSMAHRAEHSSFHASTADLLSIDAARQRIPSRDRADLPGDGLDIPRSPMPPALWGGRRAFVCSVCNSTDMLQDGGRLTCRNCGTTRRVS